MNRQNRRKNRAPLTLFLIAVLCAILTYRADQLPYSSTNASLAERILMVVQSDWHRVVQRGEDNPLPIPEGSEAPQTVQTPISEKWEKPLPDGYRYYFTLLNEKQQALYEKVAAGIQSHSETLRVFGNLTTEEAFQTVRAVENDYPEFFWFNGRVTARTHSGIGGSYQELIFDYSMNMSEAEEYESRLNRIATSLTDKLWTATEYGKVRGVYEYLIENTDYDGDAEEEQSLLPVLLEHHGVCASYARSFQYLMNRLGIDAIYVHGTAENSLGVGNHAWNIVRINGDFYQVDVTWGDPLTESEEGTISYSYLNVTTAEIERNHTMDRNWAMPECTATRYNYYTVENALFSDYDEDRLSELLAEAYRTGEWCRIKAADRNAYLEICENMERNSWLTGIAARMLLKGYSIRSGCYSCDDDMYCVNILLT